MDGAGAFKITGSVSRQKNAEHEEGDLNAKCGFGSSAYPVKVREVHIALTGRRRAFDRLRLPIGSVQLSDSGYSFCVGLSEISGENSFMSRMRIDRA
jgi:hypothetical protein